MASAETPEGTSQKIIQIPQNERGVRHINIGGIERLISIAIGIPVTIFGLTLGVLKGLVPTLFGGTLLYRGVTGHSFLYQALGVSTVEQSPAAVAVLPNNQGMRVKRAVMINSSPENLYRYWRNLQNATRFMEYVESVQVSDERHSHWVAKTPKVGMTVEWDAEITNDEPGRLIVWKKTHGSFLAPTGGLVHFESKGNGRGTMLQSEIDYRQFRGPIGTMLGRMLGQIPEQEVREDLRHFKELMEAGEIPTTRGQPTGRRV